ncbi:hypothetical protein RYX36_020644 [Vicia faba]
MILDKYDIEETHYEVLSIKEDADYEEVRSSYRSVVLSLHPDKLLKTFNTSGSNQTSTERFLRVQKAWEILSDSSSRLFFDKQLQSSRRDVLAAEVAEDLSLHDMEAEDADEALELFYQCRCGDYNSVNNSSILFAQHHEPQPHSTTPAQLPIRVNSHRSSHKTSHRIRIFLNRFQNPQPPFRHSHTRFSFVPFHA